MTWSLAGTDADRRARLAALDLRYEWNPLGAVWLYQRDLTWRLWAEHPGTAWGERAFLSLQLAGWDTSRSCDRGMDQFREVIARGEEFVRDRPRSAVRGAVLFTLALAYETWWSLGRAPPTDEYVDPAQYAAGADSARERALAYYRQALAADLPDAVATYAQRQLQLLARGDDTRQRRYFCIYD